jgi:molybdopterin-binding protein
MRVSAKNQLKGVVKSITSGAVNCEVSIELPGGAVITSIITKSSAESLGLKPGVPAYAIVKASNVIVGVD